MALIRHLHESTRFDRPAAALRAVLHYWRHRVSLVTLTEIRGREIDLRGWTTLTGPGDSGILVRDRAWKVRTAWTELLSETPIGKDGKRYVRAIFALLEHRSGATVLVSCAHLPSDVQDGDGFSTSPKVKVWRESMQTYATTIREAAAYNPDGYLVAADWNVDHRRAVWRSWIGSRFPMLHCSWTGRMPRRGTHGRRVIDATWTSFKVERIRVLRRNRSSDHRPYVETLRV